MTSVPYGNSFLLVGGVKASPLAALDTIYQFDVDQELFRLLPARLDYPSLAHTVLPLTGVEFPACFQ